MELYQGESATNWAIPSNLLITPALEEEPLVLPGLQKIIPASPVGGRHRLSERADWFGPLKEGGHRNLSNFKTFMYRSVSKILK